MLVKEVLKVRKYKAGYEVRTEIWGGEDYYDADMEVKAAYTPTGDYIGESNEAHNLCKILGIKPEKANPLDEICSIGFCENNVKWYGWDYGVKNIRSFSIGDKVTKDSAAYIPDNIEEWKELNYDFLSGFTKVKRFEKIDDKHYLIKGTETYSSMTFATEEELKAGKEFFILGEPYESPIDIRITLGRGEWTAETLEDCKQMAMDFAEGVG